MSRPDGLEPGGGSSPDPDDPAARGARGYVVQGSRVVYEGRLSRVRIDRVRLPDGETVEREVTEHPSAVAVVPLDLQGRLVLLRQYRQPVGAELLEIPAGILDVAGEDPVDAARRELAEEVRLHSEELDPLVTFHNSAGWTEERTTVYLASACRPAPAPEGFTPEGEELHMRVVRMPFEEALARAERGEVTDAKTLVGILMAARRR